MKPLWITIIVGVLGLASTYFLTRSNVVREYEGKFAVWQQDYIKNYRVVTETVKTKLSKEDSIAIAESRPVYRWMKAKPIDSLAIANIIFGLSVSEKDSLLSYLAQERQAEAVTDTNNIETAYGDTVTVVSTHLLSYSPFMPEPFGRFSYINSVTYPRSGTTVVTKEVEKENTRFFHSLSFAFHGGYAFELKRPALMLETYAKLRLQSHVYLAPRYDLRYINNDLVRTASLGLDYTIE